MAAAAVPAVVLQHVESRVDKEGGAGHGLVAWLLLRVTKLLHHVVTVSQQLVQPQLPAHPNKPRRLVIQFQGKRQTNR